MLQINQAELSNDMQVGTHLSLHALKTSVYMYGSRSVLDAWQASMTSPPGKNLVHTAEALSSMSQSQWHPEPLLPHAAPCQETITVSIRQGGPC